MRHAKSCGVILFRDVPERAFLLMRHGSRLDLPKGHTIGEESEMACALRELFEETGYRDTEVKIDPVFRHENTFRASSRRFGGELVEKTLVIFLGQLLVQRDPRLTEHDSWQWIA